MRRRLHQCVTAYPLFPFLNEHVVPLPLHIYLGLGKQLMDMVDEELVNELDHDDFAALMERCKGTPLNIYSGQKYSSIQSFNGGELKKLVDAPDLPLLIDRLADEERRVYFHILHQSVQSLRPFLLSNDTLESQQLDEFNELVNLIGDAWPRRQERVKPKVHMLFHCVAFAREHNALGRYGEAAIESSHHDVHFKFEEHGNNGRYFISKQRRMHSDIIQRRVSRVESGAIPPAPVPRLCPNCQQPWAKHLNGGHEHRYA